MRFTVIAYLKMNENFFFQSDCFVNYKDAKLNVIKKIIVKYLTKNSSREIIHNIRDFMRNEKKFKKNKNEFYTELLKNKRAANKFEFLRRLPYFNMLEKDKKIQNNINNNENGLIEEENENELYFSNNIRCPIDKILLGDLSIVDYHLNDFKYNPMKIFEMIYESEKRRGVDFQMVYSILNEKSYSINVEATIFSQKLGIKVTGYGKSKEEAGNKSALKLLSILFKNKFKSYFELHDYFEYKNKNYLDIILNDEPINMNNAINEQEDIESNFKNKKKKFEINNNDINYSLNYNNNDIWNIGMNGIRQDLFNKNKLNESTDVSNANIDIHDIKGLTNEINNNHNNSNSNNII